MLHRCMWNMTRWTVKTFKNVHNAAVVIRIACPPCISCKMLWQFWRLQSSSTKREKKKVADFWSSLWIVFPHMRQTSGHMSSRSLINLWARPAFYWWGSPVTSTTCQNSSSSLFWSSFCFLFSQKLQVRDCFRGVSGLGGSQLYNLWLIARRQKRPT